MIWMIHRLMKNQINADEYLLLTEPVATLVAEAEPPLRFEHRVENYDVGTVRIRVHFPGGTENALPSESAQDSWWTRFQKMRAYFAEPRTRAQIQLKVRS